MNDTYISFYLRINRKVVLQVSLTLNMHFMQNSFISGSLGTREAEAIVDAVRRKIYSYPVADIYYAMDTHGEDYLDTHEGKNLPVQE